MAQAPTSSEGDPRPRVRVSFVLAGDALDLDDCTQLLGLHPTDAGRRGDRPIGARFPRPSTSWVLELDRRVYDLDDAVRELLEALWPRKEAVISLLGLPGVEAHLICNVEVFDESVVLGLTRHSIGRLAALGAAFGLDYYDYRSGSH